MRSKIYIEPASSERKHRKLEALGKELGIPIPMAFLEMEVTMPDGRIVHHHKQRSHSWVRNAYNHIFSEVAGVNAPDGAFGGGLLNVKRTSGAVASGSSPIRCPTSGSALAADKCYFQAASVVTSGILVGSGVNAESFEDYVLQTPIANGSGANQLAYAQSENYVVSYVAGTKTLTATHVRYMNNNSAGNVDVNEVAIVFVGSIDASVYNWVNSRDHLGATVTIPATGQLKVTYAFSLVYPA